MYVPSTNITQQLDAKGLRQKADVLKSSLGASSQITTLRFVASFDNTMIVLVSFINSLLDILPVVIKRVLRA